MQATCSATRNDGQPCGAPALPTGLCFAHDPAQRERARAGQAEGGRQKSNANRARKHLPADLQALLDRLDRGMRAVEAGEMEPARLNAIAGAARSYVVVVESGMVLARQAEFEERLEAAEAAARAGLPSKLVRAERTADGRAWSSSVAALPPNPMVGGAGNHRPDAIVGSGKASIFLQLVGQILARCRARVWLSSACPAAQRPERRPAAWTLPKPPVVDNLPGVAQSTLHQTSPMAPCLS